MGISDKKILFVSYGAAHVNALIPLYKKLKEEGFHNLVYLGLTIAQQKLKKEAIPYLGYKDFLDGNKKAIEAGKKLISTLENAGVVEEEESIAYMGLSYTELEGKVGVEKAKEVFQEKGRHAFFQLNTAQKILKKIKPDLVISTHSPKTEKAILTNTKKMNIKSLCLANLCTPNEIEDRLKLPSYGTKICVSNEYYHRELLKKGRPENEVIITGCPSFDPLFTPLSTDKVAEYKKEKGIHQEKVILWIRIGGDQNTKYCEEVEKELEKIALNNPKWHIIFRPHPNNKVSYGKLPENISISEKEENLQAIIQSSDAILVFNSTVAVEGAIVGKRIIQFLNNPFYATAPYMDMGFATGVKEMKDLEGIIEKEINNTTKPTMNIPSGATKAIVNLCRELLEE